MANNSTDCSALSSRQSFPQYIQAINQTLDGNFTLVSRCQAEVCGLLFGFGTEDVNGIGLMVGYVMANVLGIVLPLSLLFLERKEHQKAYSPLETLPGVGLWRAKAPTSLDVSSRLKIAIEKSLWRFFESAALLSFSIQIAAIVVLVQLDFGISANGMGGTTGKITRAVSIVNLIPFTYTICAQDLIDLIRRGSSRANISSKPQRRAHVKTLSRDASPLTWRTKSSEAVENMRNQLVKRFVSLLTFAVCWATALYPMLGTFFVYFGPSQISTGKSAVIHPDEFNRLIAPCYINVQALTDTEIRVMGALSISAVLVVIVFMLMQVSMYGAARRSPMSKMTRQLEKRKFLKHYVRLVFSSMVLVAIGQFWTIFRLEKLQNQMATSAGSKYPNDSWDFGQIVAVAVMTPIFVQGLYSFFSTRQSQENIYMEKPPVADDTSTPSSLWSTTPASSPGSREHASREHLQTGSSVATTEVSHSLGYVQVPQLKDPLGNTIVPSQMVKVGNFEGLNPMEKDQDFHNDRQLQRCQR